MVLLPKLLKRPAATAAYDAKAATSQCSCHFCTQAMALFALVCPVACQIWIYKRVYNDIHWFGLVARICL